MNALETLVLILFVVVVVTAIAQRIKIPYPLLLVIAGLIVGWIPGIPNWHPPSDLVLIVFLPPILFAAARTVAWHEIRSNLASIGWLSIALVFITTFGMALILDRFIPVLSFGTALLLGAIISPTDTVAAVAILSKMHVRQNLIRTIELESLFNDATGIVLYNAAVLFLAVGTLHLVSITWHTFLVGTGGIAIGLLLAYFTNLIVRQFLKNASSELPIIMSLVLAYVAYLVALRLDVSGILAVVAAGLYHKKIDPYTRAQTRLSETAVWDTLIFFLNGIIFIVIGIQFPSYLQKVDFIPGTTLVFYSALVIISLLLIRFFWVGLIYTLRRCFVPPKEEDLETTFFPLKTIIILSWSGMRGLVPLALALALPSMTSIGQFPNRSLIIFLTIVTILFTLLAQGFTLPSLIRWLGVEKDDQKQRLEINDIYQRLTKHSIKNMSRLMNDEDNSYSAEAKKLVENYYADRLLHFTVRSSNEQGLEKIGFEAEALLNKILQHEREQLYKLRKKGKINEEMFIGLLSKLDRDEVSFSSYLPQDGGR